MLGLAGAAWQRQRFHTQHDRRGHAQPQWQQMLASCVEHGRLQRGEERDAGLQPLYLGRVRVGLGVRVRVGVGVRAGLGLGLVLGLVLGLG